MTQDFSWKHSHAPVLMVRREPDRRIGWQANEAALLWARERDIDDTELDQLATDVGQLDEKHADGAFGSTPGRHGDLHWHAVPWDDGWLAWCLPQGTFVPTAEQKLDRLDILRHSGRVGMIVGVHGADGGQWDASAYRLWGFPANGPRPTLREMIDRVHPHDQQRVVALLHAQARSAGYADEPFRLRMPNGDVRHLHMMVNVTQDDNGQPTDLAGVIIDDTETIERYLAQRKVAADALEALELAGVAVWRQSLVTGRIVGDAVFHQRMHTPPPPAELDHEWMMAQHHPDDQAGVREANTRALQSKEAVDAVVRVKGDDGQSYRTLLTRRVARRDARGQPMELVGVSMDIGALVRVNEQAQTWARRAELAATASGVGFWYLDPATGEGEWDTMLYKLHGCDPQEPTPNWSAWVQRFVVDLDRKPLAQWLRSGEAPAPFQGRCRILRADGFARWIEIALQPETRHDPTRWIAMVSDVTDKIAAGALLRTEQQRARFAADAAQLGVWECSIDAVPLYWSDRMVELLGFEAGSQRPLRELWACLRPACTRLELKRLIREHAERRDALQHEMRVLWNDGSEHWIALRARVLPGPPGQDDRVYGVCWDVTERRQADQRHHQNVVALADARAREQVMARLGWQLRTSLNSVLGFAKLAADSPDVPAQVKQWLAQAHVAGSGLLQHLEQLDPCSRPAPRIEAPASSPALATPGKPLTVLYIEDNSLNLLLVQTLLANRGDIALHTAIDGRSGIDAVMRVHPDLVLIDMQLPDLDGYQVLERIRHVDAPASTLCVVLSADNSRNEMARALAAGFDDYWTKPIDIPQFVARLTALAQGEPLRRAPPQ
ncbi:MAG: PAS domain-containing protein [Burkholderiaceae bacterium]|nr:PAS domain-containing protein [Burkholderiaceae bacterium]